MHCCLRHVMRISPWCLALLACHAGLVSAASVPDQPSDQLLGFARERWYNPSLVLLPDGSAMCAIKDTKQVKKRSMGKPTLSRTVWVNRLYMCTGSAEDLNSLSCKPFDPWKTKRHRECEFGTRVRKGKLDTSGLGDVKVWRWPGKGVYAIFGRKHQRESSSWCEGLVVYHQWIAQVSADPGLKEDDPWHLNDGGPLAVLPDMTTHRYPGNPPYVMEKNWRGSQCNRGVAGVTVQSEGRVEWEMVWKPSWDESIGMQGSDLSEVGS